MRDPIPVIVVAARPAPARLSAGQWIGLLILAIIVAVIAAIVVMNARGGGGVPEPWPEPDPVPVPDLQPGDYAPEWKLQNVHDMDQWVGLTDYRGKIVLLDFWATWCGPCAELSAKELLPLYDEYKDNDDFVLVSIGTWEDDPKAEADYATDHGYDWTFVFDGPDGYLAEEYGVWGIPHLCLIDEDGYVLVNGTGWDAIDEVKAVLAERLGGSNARPDPGYPDWYTSPPQEPGMAFYGIGLCTNVMNHALAMQAADDRARRDIAATLQAKIAAILKSYLRSVLGPDMLADGDEEQVVQDTMLAVIEGVNVGGAEIVKRDVGRQDEDGSWPHLSLARIGFDRVAESLYNETLGTVERIDPNVEVAFDELKDLLESSQRDW